jgi:hypothetical protein
VGMDKSIKAETNEAITIFIETPLNKNKKRYNIR